MIDCEAVTERVPNQIVKACQTALSESGHDQVIEVTDGIAKQVPYRKKAAARVVATIN
ncbi:hypothetical protein [Fischerella muscicola]|uniref:hypothetical protein n=1 Tax=Fischerella muscicola TaxID=92938 RepID=UPI0015E13E46|nr:hypothetical protein [Fischerella muscicola]